MARKQPADDYRCTGTDAKHGRRCSRPRLPGITLCRNHHLQQLQPSTTTTTTTTTIAKPAAKKTARTLKNNPLTLPSTAADNQSSPSKKRSRPTESSKITLPIDGNVQCKRNNGVGGGLPNTAPTPAFPAMPEEKPSAGNLEFLQLGDFWALPATRGGPPRSYARIDRINNSSRRAVVTLLEPLLVSDEEIGWVKEGRTLACGTFRAISSPTAVNISSLSHPVYIPEAGKYFFKILPRAGEVWAVYDGLEIGATHHLVEIVSGFTKDAGLTAARLVPAEGCGFRRDLHGRHELLRTFSRSDLRWFSHQVMAIRTEEEDAGRGGLWMVFS